MTLNPSALTLVLGSIISTHSAAAWFILLPLNPQLLLLLPPKGFSFSSNLLHCPPTCCLALWTSRFTDTHITTPSRRFSENRINLDSLLISYIYWLKRSRFWWWNRRGYGGEMWVRPLSRHLEVWLGQKPTSIWPQHQHHITETDSLSHTIHLPHRWENSAFCWGGNYL